MRSPWPAFCENSRFKIFKTPSPSFEGAILLEMPLVAAVDGEVESCLRWQKNFFYREDKHVLGPNSWGEAWTILTNIALSLAQLQRKERTLKEVREKCHANPKKTQKNLDSPETC